MTHDQGPLQGERQLLDQPPRLELRVLSAEHALYARACAREMRVEPRVRAGRELTLGDERRQALGLLDDRPQHIQGGYVSGPLPDRTERRVAVQQRHRRLLHEPVPAEALERLAGKLGGALA